MWLSALPKRKNFAKISNIFAIASKHGQKCPNLTVTGVQNYFALFLG
jgi:hypothetical protein